MSTLPDTIPCKKCGGEGHLVCRPNIYTLEGDLYTVDCEDCDNSTNDEHAEPAKAIEQWNAEQASCANAEGETRRPSATHSGLT